MVPVMGVLPGLQRCIRITSTAGRRSVILIWSFARSAIRKDENIEESSDITIKAEESNADK